MRLATLALLAASAACAGGEADTASLALDEAPADTAMAAAAATPAAEAELTAADLDAYERGLTAEVAVLREALERRANARTGEDTLAALMAAAEMQSVPAAAERAGLDVDRYRRLDDVFGAALAGRAMNPGMLAQVADTSQIAQLPADVQERARTAAREAAAAFSDSATYRTVPPALVETFKERAAQRLDALWKERLETRARAAGLGG